jgi:hypothetical protein
MKLNCPKEKMKNKKPYKLVVLQHVIKIELNGVNFMIIIKYVEISILLLGNIWSHIYILLLIYVVGEIKLSKALLIQLCLWMF